MIGNNILDVPSLMIVAGAATTEYLFNDLLFDGPVVIFVKNSVPARQKNRKMRFTHAEA
jgi:hypothetical protein